MTNGAITNVLDGRWIVVARMSHRGKTEAPLSGSGASLPACPVECSDARRWPVDDRDLRIAHQSFRLVEGAQGVHTPCEHIGPPG